jgi:hypothetical protein
MLDADQINETRAPGATTTQGLREITSPLEAEAALRGLPKANR